MSEIQRVQFKRMKRYHNLKKWGLFIGLSIIITLITVMIIGHIQENNQKRAQFFSKYPIRGVSINQNSDYMDFNGFKQRGGTFVYLRSSQGAGYMDDDFSDNYARSLGSGLKVGVYHQYGFKTSIKGQTKNFSRAVDGQIGELPIRIDIDYYGKYNEKNTNKKELHTRINELVDYLYHRYNRPVLLKTNQINYRVLKDIPHTQFMLSKRDYGAKISFCKLKEQDPFYKDGKSSSDSMAAYQGNKVQWEQYVAQME